MSHPIVAMALEVLNALFYFAGFIALAVFMSRLLFCRGSVCGAAQASVAFGAFEFALWTASAVFMGKDVCKQGLLKFQFRRPGAKDSTEAPAMKEASQAA